MIKEHVPQLPLQGLCPWEKCDGLRRGKWSLLTHVQVMKIGSLTARSFSVFVTELGAVEERHGD